MRDVAAIVTGGSSGTGRECALGLARWGWAIVVVYLEQSRHAEATVQEIVASGGTTVAVAADLADDLDVQRLFDESALAFGGIDALVHTTTASASTLYRQAARHLRDEGVVVSVLGADAIPPGVERRLRARGITVGRAPPETMLSFLGTWWGRPDD